MKTEARKCWFIEMFGFMQTVLIQQWDQQHSFIHSFSLKHECTSQQDSDKKPIKVFFFKPTIQNMAESCLQKIIISMFIYSCCDHAWIFVLFSLKLQFYRITLFFVFVYNTLFYRKLQKKPTLLTNQQNKTILTKQSRAFTYFLLILFFVQYPSF